MWPQYTMLRLEFRSVRSRIFRRAGVFPIGTPDSRRPCQHRLASDQHGGLHGTRWLVPPISFSTLPSSAPELQNPFSRLDAEMELGTDRGERISSRLASGLFPGNHLASGLISVIGKMGLSPAIPFLSGNGGDERDQASQRFVIG